jgi:uncharacterized protein (DUF58 family)
VDHPRNPRAGARPALSRRTRWLERLRRWLRPPRTLRPTRAGWAFFAITFGVGFAALNTGNNLLYLVLSLMLAFLVLSGVLSESALRGIAVRRRLPRELFAETPCTVGLEITNHQRRVPAFAVLVEDRVTEGKAAQRAAGRGFALRAGPGETESRAYRCVPGRRGEIRFDGFRVSTRFPFGLFSKALTLESPQTALVYPALEPLAIPPRFGAPRQTGEGVAGEHGTGPLVSGLRHYEPGDPARRIHWRASLRRDELLVRKVESEQRAEVEVRLRTADQQPGERFERSVRWAASEVVALLEAGARVALRTDASRIEADLGNRQRGRLLGFLARVEPGAALEAP